MIRLEAISLGYAVPRGDFNATVQSVFPEAANLQSGSANRLLTVVTVDCADLPQAIRIDSPRGFSLMNRLHTGDRITCHNGILRDKKERLSIDLRQAKPWKCKLPRLDPEEITPLVSAAWTSVWQALDERQKHTSAEIYASELFQPDVPERTPMSRLMSVHIRQLVSATRNLDSSIGTSVSRLIGLGQGLTPSGDDFLVGFLTALRCMAGKNKKRQAFFRDLRKMIVYYSHQTTDISRTYLYHATRGQVSSKLASLVEAIARGEGSERLLQVAKDAMQVGHSSGMETVAGLLIGLSAWGNRLLAPRPAIEQVWAAGKCRF